MRNVKHSVADRVEAGAPNYDRIVRQTRFDPLTSIHREMWMLENRKPGLQRALEAAKVGSIEWQRLDRALRNLSKRSIAIGVALVKFGEAKAPTRVVGGDGGAINVQVGFGWDAAEPPGSGDG